MAKAPLKLVTSATKKRTVTPKRLPNGDLRTREYLTEGEVDRLMEVAKGNRYGHRDATMVLIGALGSGGLQNGHPARPQGQERHPKHPSDPRRRTAGATATSTPAGAEITLRVHLGARLAIYNGWLRPDGGAGGIEAKLGFKAHPHMLRHACGYALANKGHDTRGAASISRASQHSAHGEIHRTKLNAVYGFLANLKKHASRLN
jgi:integrase